MCKDEEAETKVKVKADIKLTTYIREWKCYEILSHNICLFDYNLMIVMKILPPNVQKFQISKSCVRERL